MAYRKIEPRLWDDEKIADLDLNAKLVWMYVLTGRHTTSLPGLWRATALTIADGLRAPVELVDRALRELEDIGRIERDVRRQIIRVPNSPRHNHADNGRVVKAWWHQWDDLPDCALKYKHLVSLREGIEERTEDAWEEWFGKVDADQELARFRTGSEPNKNCSGHVLNSSYDPALVSSGSGSLPDPFEPSLENPSEPAGVRVAQAVPLGHGSGPAGDSQTQSQAVLALVEPRKPEPQRSGKARGERTRSSESRYAEAFAAGQTDATGQPFTPPTDSGAQRAFRVGLATHAVDATGAKLRGAALDTWIREISADYRRARPRDGEFGGFTPRNMFKWLDAGGDRATPIPASTSRRVGVNVQRAPPGSAHADPEAIRNNRLPPPQTGPDGEFDLWSINT